LTLDEEALEHIYLLLRLDTVRPLFSDLLWHSMEMLSWHILYNTLK